MSRSRPPILCCSLAGKTPAFGQCILKRSFRGLGQRYVARSALKARWQFDARYGAKFKAIGLLQEWVATIGAQAGLNLVRTTIQTGAIGVAESRIEMELVVDSMAELETFWSRISLEPHRAWIERLAPLIVDGSPVWSVHRLVALGAGADRLTGSTAAGGEQGHGSMPSVKTCSPRPRTRRMVDWKGDLLEVNPGDRLPGIAFSPDDD